MSIPVYLAVRKPEFTEYPRNLIAQTGYGVSRNGKIRKPEAVTGGLIIIDDAVIAHWRPEALEELISLCQNGYFYDFEKPFLEYHKELIQALPSELLLGLPDYIYPRIKRGLPVISCPVLCNSWRQFVKKAGKIHRNGWMLEITPWNCEKSAPSGEAEGILTSSICRFKQRDGVIKYYDTRETIKEKLKLAEAEGCKAGIALLDEIKLLK